MVMTGPGWNLKPGDKSHMIIRFPEQANIEISGINSQKGIKSAISWKDLGDFLMEIKHSKYAQIDFMVSYQPWDLSAGDIANAFSAMRACTQEIK
ncbi:hypothetical protein S1001342_00708 [Acetobacter pasteurianus subsp. pasteurianus]|uniref:Uncharacterized protein n=2 Tax=Acetobacter pasteurianus TaxID=438 RepID=A0A1Y0Y7V7_ACEPA|nr:hypothetical protein S1001342_00708 [Acetobacter pasteurianus subsp. pasteurianus]